MTHDVCCDVLGSANKAFVRAFLITNFEVRGSKVLLQKTVLHAQAIIILVHKMGMCSFTRHSFKMMLYLSLVFGFMFLLSFGFLNCPMLPPKNISFNAKWKQIISFCHEVGSGQGASPGWYSRGISQNRKELLKALRCGGLMDGARNESGFI